jgi:hypothetical protein
MRSRVEYLGLGVDRVSKVWLAVAAACLRMEAAQKLRPEQAPSIHRRTSYITALTSSSLPPSAIVNEVSTSANRPPCDD